jgi:hypothetical protein
MEKEKTSSFNDVWEVEDELNGFGTFDATGVVEPRSSVCIQLKTVLTSFLGSDLGDNIVCGYLKLPAETKKIDDRLQQLHNSMRASHNNKWREVAFHYFTDQVLLLLDNLARAQYLSKDNSMGITSPLGWFLTFFSLDEQSETQQKVYHLLCTKYPNLISPILSNHIYGSTFVERRFLMVEIAKKDGQNQTLQHIISLAKLRTEKMNLALDAFKSAISSPTPPLLTLTWLLGCIGWEEKERQVLFETAYIQDCGAVAKQCWDMWGRGTLQIPFLAPVGSNIRTSGFTAEYIRRLPDGVHSNKVSKRAFEQAFGFDEFRGCY